MDMEQIQELVVTYVPSIAGVVALLVVAFIIAGWIGRIVSRVLSKAKVEETLCKFFGNMSRWVVLIMAIIACLGEYAHDICVGVCPVVVEAARDLVHEI